MKIYVAGPMRGYDKFNFPAFDEAANTLRLYGYEVVNPAELDRAMGFDESQNDMEQFDALGGIEQAMHRDFGAILECDAIALLPGWDKSTGAKAEVFIAKTTGKAVYHYVELEDKQGCYLKEADETGVELVHNGSTVDTKASPISTDYISVDPVTGGKKGAKLERIDLIPSMAIKKLAERYGHGALKYDENNWRKGYAWSLSFAALMRHAIAFWDGEDLDPEYTDSPHLAAVMWHAAALIEFGKTHPELDDRPCKLGF